MFTFLPFFHGFIIATHLTSKIVFTYHKPTNNLLNGNRFFCSSNIHVCLYCLDLSMWINYSRDGIEITSTCLFHLALSVLSDMKFVSTVHTTIFPATSFTATDGTPLASTDTCTYYCICCTLETWRLISLFITTSLDFS